jgi:hypothetical protein
MLSAALLFEYYRSGRDVPDARTILKRAHVAVRMMYGDKIRIAGITMPLV